MLNYFFTKYLDSGKSLTDKPNDTPAFTDGIVPPLKGIDSVSTAHNKHMQLDRDTIEQSNDIIENSIYQKIPKKYKLDSTRWSNENSGLNKDDILDYYDSKKKLLKYDNFISYHNKMLFEAKNFLAMNNIRYEMIDGYIISIFLNNNLFKSMNNNTIEIADSAFLSKIGHLIRNVDGLFYSYNYDLDSRFKNQPIEQNVKNYLYYDVIKSGIIDKYLSEKQGIDIDRKSSINKIRFVSYLNKFKNQGNISESNNKFSIILCYDYDALDKIMFSSNKNEPYDYGDQQR